MRLLGAILILLGAFVWAMMEYTDLGYNGIGAALTIFSVLWGIVLVTHREKV